MGFHGGSGNEEDPGWEVSPAVHEETWGSSESTRSSGVQ